MQILFSLFFTFFKIGLFTIGGGYAMIPLMKTELVKETLLTMPQLVDFIGISEATPGPFAVNVATFAGMESAGLIGAFFATLGVILPSFLIILLIAKYFSNFKDNFFVKSALYGLRPAVIGLIGSAALGIAMMVFFPSVEQNGMNMIGTPNLTGILIFGVAALMLLKFKLHPIIIITVSAALGMILYSIF